MTTCIRLAVLALVGIGLLPSTGFAQGGHGHAGRTMTASEVANHLRGYYAGNHQHGGYGYGGGAGYGYSGGFGSASRATYGGGFFFPGYGNTYGLYPYGAGYNFSPPNYDPPAALTGRYPLSTSQLLDPATGLPFLPPAPVTVSKVAPTQPSTAATIRVVLPDASAEVLLDGKATTSRGIERTYVSPSLDVGTQYTYTVVATWSRNGVTQREERTALMIPGETTLVDFTRPDQAASPPAKIDPSLAAAPDLK